MSDLKEGFWIHREHQIIVNTSTRKMYLRFDSNGSIIDWKISNKGIGDHVTDEWLRNDGYSPLTGDDLLEVLKCLI